MYVYTRAYTHNLRLCPLRRHMSVAKRSYPEPKGRGSGQEELPRIKVRSSGCALLEKL